MGKLTMTKNTSTTKMGQDVRRYRLVEVASLIEQYQQSIGHVPHTVGELPRAQAGVARDDLQESVHPGARRLEA
jgi:hypothetical protein